MTAPWKLYWCWTDDHDEDWFIVARSAQAARREHESEEGYELGAAQCSLVCRLPEARQKTTTHPGWPDHELLVACGGVEMEPHTAAPRVWRFGKRVYREGALQAMITATHDDMFEARGEGRPNGTQRGGTA